MKFIIQVRGYGKTYYERERRKKKMKDDIKEILDNMKEISSFEYTTDWFELNYEDTKILLEYITNLQNRITELEIENTILKDNNKNMQEEMIRTWEKASSLINSIHYDELHHYRVMRDIMDILKDKDEGFIQTYDKLEKYIKKELEKYE